MRALRHVIICLAAVVAALPGTAPGTAAAAPPPPAASGALATAGLTKTAQNVTHPGANPADHGDVVNWAVAYTDGATRGAVTITDPIAGAPGAQAYVPGSLRVPPGWTPSWSTDGTTFQGTEPPSGTVAVRAANPDVRPGGTSLARPLLPPVQTTAAPTGGDGFSPVLYRRRDGAVEAWNIYHHLGAAAPKVVCTNLLTGQPCAGGPWPRPLNTAAGPLGSGATGDIASTMAPQYVVDPADPDVLLYPAVTAGSVGVGCLDLGARANCGYVALVATGGSPSSVNSIGGLVATGGRLYGVATTGQVLCLTLATRTPCAGQPYAPVLPGYNDQPGNTGALYYGALTVAGGKVFASASASGVGNSLGCFDPATTTACDGWATARAGVPSGSYTFAVFTAYDTSGAAIGACVPAVSSGVPVATCYTIAGAALAAPTSLSALPAGALTFSPKTVAGTDGHLRSYFPAWGGSLAGGTVCHDWTAAAPCAGFPAVAGHPGVNGGATRDYGYDYDSTTRCLIALGDAGVLFSLDPADGTSPCVHSGASVALVPADFYCDGGTGQVKGYREARLEGIDVANVDLARSTVTATDPDGTPAATVVFAPDGTVGLSGISAAAHPALTVTANLVLRNASDFSGGNQPVLVVAFNGDAPQVCFRTRLAAACSVTAVANTATGTAPDGALTSNTVTLPIAPGTACLPQVSVNKEICASRHSRDCGPGGAGPWAKVSPAGLLGLLGTAYWRITVTNAGGVDAVGATVNDRVTPGCSAAAGTFTLPTGTAKQFYCSTFLLVLPLTNTASVTYSAAGAPPGTPPLTSAPSSATACSLLCVLGAQRGEAVSGI